MAPPRTSVRLDVPPAPPITLHLRARSTTADVSDLLQPARRAGDRRQILVVSRVLGKHLAASPDVVMTAGRALADLVGDRLSAGAGAAAPTVIGFAETATALAHVVRARLGAQAFTHTTRHLVDAAPILAFSEPHSHAPDHALFHRDPAFLADDGPVVLVDDELTTGTTVLNLVGAIEAHHHHAGYVVAVLTDLRDTAARERFDAAAARMGVPLDVVSLLAAEMDVDDDGRRGLAAPAVLGTTPDGPVDAATATPATATPATATTTTSTAATSTLAADALPPARSDGHLGWDDHDERALDRWAAAAGQRLAGPLGDGRVDVIGWEEAMYAPLVLAARLPGAVTVRATTRSPIAPATTPGYPIRDGIGFHVGDGVPRHLYNLHVDPPDHIVLCTPATPPPALVARLAAVAPVHVLTLPTPVAKDTGAATPPATATRTGADPGDLPDPPTGFGSYDPDDVTFLLTPLADGFAESTLEEREHALQAGAHYSERLPMEYEPSADYMRLFHEVLARQAGVVADLVGMTARRILEVRGDGPFVLVSLARAGTPVGVLLRRYLQAHHGIDAPHRSISIIRDRGLDRTAIRWLQATHPGMALQFVDGWTGKGAIQRELTAECRVLGLDDRMAVLADPGGCAAMPGTRADVLIPSACLNATVSGLVSRTVLTDELRAAGGFHGAKHYAHLAPVDLSAHFVDTVAARFRPPGELPGALPSPAGGPRTDPLPPGALHSPWTGHAGALAVAQAHGVGDLNLVKPGLGEAIRVLLRRRPRLLLLREHSLDTEPLRQLADERAIPVQLDPALHVAACGLIR